MLVQNSIQGKIHQAKSIRQIMRWDMDSYTFSHLSKSWANLLTLALQEIHANKDVLKEHEVTLFKSAIQKVEDIEVPDTWLDTI